MLAGDALGLVPEGSVCRVQVGGHRVRRELVLAVQAEVAGQVGFGVPAAGGQAGGRVCVEDSRVAVLDAAQHGAVGVLGGIAVEDPGGRRLSRVAAEAPGLGGDAAGGCGGLGVAGVPGGPESLVVAAGAMKTSPPWPGGQVRWSSRGALSMRSISPLVASR